MYWLTAFHKSVYCTMYSVHIISPIYLLWIFTHLSFKYGLYKDLKNPIFLFVCLFLSNMFIHIIINFWYWVSRLYSYSSQCGWGSSAIFRQLGLTELKNKIWTIKSLSLAKGSFLWLFFEPVAWTQDLKQHPTYYSNILIVHLSFHRW